MPVQVFTSSPIHASKADGVTPKTAGPEDGEDYAAVPATTTAATTTTTGQYGYPPAQPGARPSLPIQTGAPQPPYANNYQPTQTQSSSNPPPSQPGAVPSPPGGRQIPPPPRAGEPSPQPPQITSMPMPPQMNYPAPTASFQGYRATSTSTAPLSYGPKPTFIQGGDSGGVDFSHPPGYQQNTNAADFSSSQRAAYNASLHQTSTGEEEEGCGESFEAQILDPNSPLDFFGAIEDVLYIPSVIQDDFTQDASQLGYGGSIKTCQGLTSSTGQHSIRHVSATTYDDGSSLSSHRASSSSSSGLSGHLFPVASHYLTPRGRGNRSRAQYYERGNHPLCSNGRLASCGSNTTRRNKRRSKKAHRAIRPKSLPTAVHDADGRAKPALIERPKVSLLSGGFSNAHPTEPTDLKPMPTPHGFLDLDGPPNLFKSFSGEQEPPPQEDLSPSDPNLVPVEQKPRFESDLYTPRWIRGHGTKREGWCGLCRPGRWLRMKNSTFWYDKSFSHGISATTGLVFQGPLGTRRGGGNSIVWEGFCGHCGQWVPLASMRGKGTAWFKHAYKVT
ncbi:Transcription regulator rua1 [Cladobotryum mycophilum]|uniref:Transcription regulator rua1 n=1 Tax=Cladobotryum mycophilum TaxID=491253 RepID=A0ABR0SCP4_9HYPO